MRNLLTLFLAFFFTTLAFASHTPSPAQTESATQEIVLVSHVDFNKSLNLVMLDVELETFTLRLEDQRGNEIFRTQVRRGESEVMEIDLSDIDGGTYKLKIEAEDQVQTESVIVPIG